MTHCYDPLSQTLQKQSCKNNQGLKSPWKLSFHSAAIWQALQEHDGKNWETEEELLPSGHQAPKLSLITSTGLNLINCKNIHYSPSSALLLCVHTRYNLFAHSSCTSLFILIFIKSTVDCIAHFSSLHILLLILFYFLLIFYLIPTYIYIYSPVLCFIFYFIFCTVHWADLSWPTFHCWLYPVWLCMWQINKNLEPLLFVSLHFNQICFYSMEFCLMVNKWQFELIF